MMEILVAHRLEEIPSLRERRPDAPDELDPVFCKMVEKQPEDRFESMAAVIGDLNQVRGTQSTLGVNFVKHDYRMARIVS